MIISWGLKLSSEGCLDVDLAGLLPRYHAYGLGL